MAAEYLLGTPGERIRDLRKEAKLNQDEFAESIGISRSTLGDIECCIVQEANKYLIIGKLNVTVLLDLYFKQILL